MNKNNSTINISKKKGYTKPAMIIYDVQPSSLLQSSVSSDGIDYGGEGSNEYGD